MLRVVLMSHKLANVWYFIVVFQQQAFAVSEVNLKEDPTDDSIIDVILQHQKEPEDNWVMKSLTWPYFCSIPAWYQVKPVLASAA